MTEPKPGDSEPSPEIVSGLSARLLDPAEHFDGCRGIADAIYDMSEQPPFSFFKSYPYRLTADWLSKAAYWHRIESEYSIDRPSFSVLSALSIKGGSVYGPAMARGLYELEQAGNPLVDELLDGEIAAHAEQGRPEAADFLKRSVREPLDSLRTAGQST